MDEILKCDHSNERYWAMLSCAAVYYEAVEVVLSFESVNFRPRSYSVKWKLLHQQYFPVVLLIMIVQGGYIVNTIFQTFSPNQA